MLAFAWSPVQFFEARLRRRPNWALAFGFPILCGLLDMVSVFILGGKNQVALEQMLGPAMPPGAFQAARISTVLTVAGYPTYFALTAMILASLDALMHDSGRQRRLVEFAGVAFLAFIPSCVFMIGVALFWMPPAIGPVGGSLLDLEAATARYLSGMHADPWLSTARLLYYFCLVWYVALLAVILRVAGAFSVRAAAGAAAAIFAGFSGFWR
ncbi:MAG: YIP1 family protein [Acidobacteriota bacterium]|nr:YIP1 family protein [Acidobacteriota bacterium]